MQFTEKYIQSLKPKTQRYDVREGGGEGFAIRIFPSGQKSWVFFYYFESRKRRMTFGNYPKLSLANARKAHRQALSMVANGHDPGLIKQNQKLEARTCSTIEDLIEEYLEKWAKPRKRSWKADEKVLFKEVKPLWGKRKAKDIVRRDILLLLDKIKERGAPIQANRVLACVRRMFNFAIERDIIPSSPCVAIKAPSKENRRDRCLSIEEIKIFWHGLEKSPMSKATRLVLKLQLVTAQRKGEIVAAEWKEIDLQTGWWTIPAEKAKNSHAHRVPLSKLALELIEEIKILCSNSRWLFPSFSKQDKHILPTAINRAVLRGRKKITDISDLAANESCNVEQSNKNILPNDLTPHDLRRTAASMMTSIGVPRIVVSKILNHIDSSVTAVYDRHSYDTEKRDALERWSLKLAQIINDKAQVNNVIDIKQKANF